MGKQYRSKDVSVIVTNLDTNVTRTVTDVPDGDFVTAEFETPLNTKVTGALGSTTFIESANESGEVTIMVKGTSPIRRFFRQCINNNANISVKVVDGNNDSRVFVSGQGRFMTRPGMGRGTDLGDQEYTVGVENLKIVE